MVVPYVSGNVPTTILVRPLAVVEHPVKPVTRIRHELVVIIDWHNSFGQLSRRPFESITQGKLLPDRFVAVLHVHKRLRRLWSKYTGELTGFLNFFLHKWSNFSSPATYCPKVRTINWKFREI